MSDCWLTYVFIVVRISAILVIMTSEIYDEIKKIKVSFSVTIKLHEISVHGLFEMNNDHS